MNRPLSLALMASTALPAPGAAGDVPDWVHLLPAGEVRTHDGRGPYSYDAAALLAASLADPRGLLIDQDHATDLAAPKGGEAPARGWIVDLQARDDGVWGRVEWTSAGRALLADRAYRGVSPVIRFDEATHRILAIMRASLVNAPNLRGLTALHSEGQDDMDWQKVAEALGLPATATADEALAKATELTGKVEGSTALHASLAEIGTALGVEDADQAAILVAAKAAVAGTGDATDLHAQVSTLKGELDALKGRQARAASEAYVDGEMAKGRIGLNATTRDDFVALHMEQPDRAAKIIGQMSVIGPGAARPQRQAAPEGGVIALNAEQAAAATALGVDPTKYLETLRAEAA